LPASFQCPSSKLANPVAVPATRTPWLSSDKEEILAGPFGVIFMCPLRSRPMRPDAETIQRLPSRVAHSTAMEVPGNFSPAGGSNLVNRTPSKRYKPEAVPNHKYPSVVCASATIEAGAPSRSVQDVWTNCVIAFCGSSAQIGRVQSQRESHPQFFTIISESIRDSTKPPDLTARANPRSCCTAYMRRWSPVFLCTARYSASIDSEPKTRRAASQERVSGLYSCTSADDGSPNEDPIRRLFCLPPESVKRDTVENRHATSRTQTAQNRSFRASRADRFADLIERIEATTLAACGSQNLRSF
jgi:hypothetical protein